MADRAGIIYDAPPTCAACAKDDHFGRLIAGPIGSGKTTLCIMEMFLKSAQQRPALDGFRYTRWAIVRQTLKQLEDTVLKDIMTWFEGAGKGIEYKVSNRTIYLQIGDIRSEWLLIPLDDKEDQRRLLSLQLTGAWMSECIEMDVNLVGPLSGRCGRYPSGPRGVATWRGIIADTNFPTEGSDWHEFMENPPPDWAIFKQPSGLSDEAENLPWLEQTEETLMMHPDDPKRLAQGRLYYERAARNKNKDWVKRYVHAQYGSDPSGTAVFKNSFSMDVHVVDYLDPVPGMMLIVGQDFGRDPWSVICQLDHKNRLLVLEEVAAEDIGLDAHIRTALRPALFAPRYSNRPIAVVGDPSGGNRSSLYETNEFDMLTRKYGFTAEKAVTNDIERRLLSVEGFMLDRRDGEPMFLVDASRCPTIVRALNGGYRYKRMKSGQRAAKPDKSDDASHPMDALQYAALCCAGDQYKGILGRIMYRGQRTEARRGRKPTALGWT
jgi:hypothetical protein